MIAIVGAGISGLTLGALLTRARPHLDFVILERDASPDARPQGYSLTLAEPALIVLREMGLLALLEDAREVEKVECLLNHRGRKLIELDFVQIWGEKVPLTFPRLELRRRLLKTIDPIRVRFGFRCVGLEKRNGALVARSDDGQTFEANVVTACDGANSAIRAQLTSKGLDYVGLSSISGEVAMSSPAELDVSRADYTIFGPHSCLYLLEHPLRREALRWRFVERVPEGQFPRMTRTERIDHVISRVRSWEPRSLVRVIESTSAESTSVREFRDRRQLHPLRDGRVFLLGDAAHPMTPFVAGGANMAIVDAWELAKLLIDCDAARVTADSPEWEMRASEFEKAVRRRNVVRVKKSRKAGYVNCAAGLQAAFRDASLRAAALYYKSRRSARLKGPPS
jgi:2-polyprenyl-6-methoxyphenol hydroxylase-like FAD-dependent oxidoreductase